MATTVNRDEENLPVDPDLPLWVTTPQQLARWGLCVGIAERVTRKMDPDPEARMFATTLYDSPMATGPLTDDPAGRLADAELAEAVTDAMRRRFDELLHPRDRRGEFARKMVALQKLPPSSPGSLGEEWYRQHGYDEYARPGETAKALLGGARSTAEIHRLRKEEESGEFRRVPYDSGRTGLHNQIEDEMLAGKTPEPGKPVALFTAGGTGSGKSTWLDKHAEEVLDPQLRNPAHTVRIDPDKLMEELPEYDELVAARDAYAAQAVHDEAADLAARIAMTAGQRGLNVIFEGTGGGNPEPFLHALEHFKHSHDVEVMYVDRPTDEAVALTIERALTNHRHVPLRLVRRIHREVSANFIHHVSRLKWLKSIDVYGPGPEGHMYRQEGESGQVFHPEGFERFMSKAGEEPPELEEADSSASFPSFLHGSGANGDGRDLFSAPHPPFHYDWLLRRAATPAERDEMLRSVEEADLAEAAVKHSGVMVALYPKRGLARKLAQKGGEPAKDLHVTLTFHGKQGDLDDPAKLNDVVRAWAHGTPPLEGSLSGTGLFTGGPEPVTYASVDVPALPEARQRLAQSLEGVGLEPSKDHGFTPHMTLAYDKRDVTLPPQTKVRFDDVHVVVGGEHTVHPLAGS